MLRRLTLLQKNRKKKEDDNNNNNNKIIIGNGNLNGNHNNGYNNGINTHIPINPKAIIITKPSEKFDDLKISRKKITIVGDEQIGKTCLMMRLLPNRFHDELFNCYVPTIFENNLITSEFIGKKIQLALWDTAGDEQYDLLRPLSYKGSDVLVICYSVVSAKSAINCYLKYETEAQKYCPNVPIVLIGLKTDLRDNGVDDDKKIIDGEDNGGGGGGGVGDSSTITTINQFKQLPFISLEQGQKLAKKINAWDFVECSAKNNSGVEDVIRAITTAAMYSGKTAKSKSKNKNKFFKKNSYQDDDDDDLVVDDGGVDFLEKINFKCGIFGGKVSK